MIKEISSVIIAPSHVRTVYKARKTTVTVNSIFHQTAPYRDVAQNILIRNHKADPGLEMLKNARYTKAQQNVAGTSLCDLRRSA